MKIQVVVVLVASLAIASGKSVRQLMVRTNFVGEGSNDLAVHLLQSESKSGENSVFSPLGYNAILAILAEGARGETRNQLARALNLPEDTYAVRSTYKTVLSSMTEHGVLNQPEFKSWFYVYKNNSVEESYKNVLRDNYLIDIKEVDRYTYPEDDEQEPNNPVVTTATKMDQRPQEDSKEDSSEEKKEGDKSEESKEDDSSEEKVTDNIAQESVGQKGGDNEQNIDEDQERVTTEVAVTDENKKEDGNQEVDDKPDLNEVDDETAAKNAALMEPTTKPAEIVDEMTTEAISENQVDPKAEDAQENSKGDRMDLEDIIARSLKSEIKGEREMVSALSANRLASLGDGGLKPNSRMIIFNALYFRGNWSTPMQSHNEKVSFATAGGEKMVEAMTGEDELETGRIPDLGATALDLPYQGDKYSMLILLPDDRDGLGELVKRLSGFSFKNIGQYLSKKSVNVCIPKFRFYTISKPKDALLKSGIKDIFGEEADLSGITGSRRLYLDDLVQLVTLDVDESHSSNVQLTSGIASETRSTGVSTFKANHPFMFVVRDRQENLVVVAGLVQNPSVNRD
uniref:Serpin B8 n=1 Tax=Lygus hesperus TaxID=30085 RepID=A0A146M4Z1_LYGHE